MKANRDVGIYPIDGLPEGWVGNVQPNTYGDWVATVRQARHAGNLIAGGPKASVVGTDPILMVAQCRAAAWAMAAATVEGAA